ncbi:MAG: class I SAM-dependent methyltransferase [Chloroflexota bacterium]
MNHEDHVALIRDGVTGAGPRWLELGPGDGAFTLALAEVLGVVTITAIDRDRNALARLETALRRYPQAALHATVGDFTKELPVDRVDGVLAANSLHFVRDRRSVLQRLLGVLAADGRLVVVEYDADRSNPWVPHPFSFATWQHEASVAGFTTPRLVGSVPSRFLGAIYAAVCFVEQDAGPLVDSAPHGDDREE